VIPSAKFGIASFVDLRPDFGLRSPMRQLPLSSISGRTFRERSFVF
jgi:hypothetical protein